MANRKIVFDISANTAKLVQGMNQANQRMATMSRSLVNMAKTAGLAFGAALVGKVMLDAIKVIAEFERAMSRVEAISGATAKQIRRLTDNARELGKTTRFTASEVAGLEVEFAKLGFTTDEIINLSAATLNLASVAGGDLANAAIVAGSTLRAFQLDASEATRVIDVMVGAFTTSALDIQKFSVSMATVAPIARLMGVSLERTTAMLGLLVDRGIDATTAGTGLRNIFLDLSKHGLTFQQALNIIDQATDKAGAAFDLFGKRGATVAATLAELQVETFLQTKALEDTEGIAKKAADTIENNLIGAWLRLKSAMVEFTLSGGAVAKLLRGIVEATTAAINIINDFTFVIVGMTVIAIPKIKRLGEAMDDALIGPIPQAKILKTIGVWEELIEVMKDTSTGRIADFVPPTVPGVTGGINVPLPTFDLQLDQMDIAIAQMSKWESNSLLMAESLTDVNAGMEIWADRLEELNLAQEAAKIDIMASALDAMAGIVSIMGNEFTSMGQKAVRALQTMLASLLNIIPALITVGALTNPAKLLAGLGAGLAALGIAGAILNNKQQKILLEGRISGRDIHLAVLNEDAANASLGGRTIGGGG